MYPQDILSSSTKKRLSRLKYLRKAYDYAYWYPFSWIDYAINRHRFAELESFLMFIGYPRSGHSLIGQLMNAHPDVLLAHQLGAADYILAGFDRRQIFTMIDRKDRSFAGGNYVQTVTGYDYSVPGSSQGQTRKPKIIGDKSGPEMSWAMDRDPALIEKIRNTLRGLPLKVINHVRSPYDSIATDAVRQGRTVSDATQRYRRLAKAVHQAFQSLGPDEKITTYHEEFVADPQAGLVRLCCFVGLEPQDDYLEACSAVVFETAQKSRHRVKWSQKDIAAVESLCSEFEVFHRYADDRP